MTYTKTSNEPKLFILAQKALMNVIKQVPTDKWNEEVTFQTSTSSTNKKSTFQETINYHSYDDAWIPETFSGKTVAEVGSKYDGDLLGDNPQENYKKYAQQAVDFMEGVTDLDKVIHFSYGDYSAAEGLNHVTLFRTMRAMDIARFIGVECTLPEELAKGMYEFVKSQEAFLRQVGVIDAAVPVEDNASYQEKLLAITGRKPN